MQGTELAIAFALDLILGDPRGWPHPVKLMGWVIIKAEALLRRAPLPLRLSGAFLAMGLPVATFLLTHAGLTVANGLDERLGFGLRVLLLYTAFSVGSLGTEAMKVYQALKRDSLTEARGQVAGMVGRDTESMNQEEVIRACVESVAENTTDGVVSPLFYACIGGAPLALAFKAISTLDSMIGYKTPEHALFGWASARLDDLANFIPARLSAPLMALSASFVGKNSLRALKAFMRDGGNHPSPNSGLAEAAMAGALGIRLGGLNSYQGVASFKPYIGDAISPMEPSHIKEAVHIMYVTSVMTLIMGLFLRGFF